MLNTAEHEIFSANKYENANNSWHLIFISREMFLCSAMFSKNPVSILRKSIAGRYRPVRVADEPITARCRLIKNASWESIEKC